MASRRNPYFFYTGLKQLAQDLQGDEHVYLGIRPYGFHAGNQLTLYIYPLLLCQQLERLHKKVALKLFVFLNDWEQDGLLGPDLQRYPFNVWPKTTTFQYLPDQFGCCASMADHWSPIIFKGIAKIRKDYPLVKVEAIRNSQMRDMPEMKKTVLDTIQYPEKIYKILKKYSTRDILSKPIVYSLAVCPKCRTTNGHTSYLRNRIMHICNTCKVVYNEDYNFFNYWLYHKPLAIPRIKIFNIQVCITGADHYSEGDYTVRKKLFEAFNVRLKNYPKTLYAPTVYASDGQQMGKSRGNTKSLPDNALYKLAIQTDNTIIHLP